LLGAERLAARRKKAPTATGLVQKVREPCLPRAAVLWIIETPDFKNFLEPQKPDPRAAYFRRAWPYGQP
jgi:hypothetical protein